MLLLKISISPKYFTYFDLNYKIYSFKDFYILAKCSSLYFDYSYFSMIKFYIFLFNCFYNYSPFRFVLFTSRLKFSIFIAFYNTYSFNLRICLSMNWLFYFRLDSTPLVLDFYNSLFVEIYFIYLFFVSSMDSRTLFRLLI